MKSSRQKYAKKLKDEFDIDVIISKSDSRGDSERGILHANDTKYCKTRYCLPDTFACS